VRMAFSNTDVAPIPRLASAPMGGRSATRRVAWLIVAGMLALVRRVLKHHAHAFSQPHESARILPSPPRRYVGEAAPSATTRSCVSPSINDGAPPAPTIDRRRRWGEYQERSPHRDEPTPHGREQRLEEILADHRAGQPHHPPLERRRRARGGSWSLRYGWPTPAPIALDSLAMCVPPNAW
jgi:hypothetical protein